MSDCDGALKLPALPPCASSAAKARMVTVYVPVCNVVTVVDGAMGPPAYGTLIVGWPLIEAW